MAWTFYDAAGNNGTVQLGTLGIASGGTGAVTAAAALTALGVGTTDNPQFASIQLGDASDTTITRGAAGQPVVVTKTAGSYNGAGYWFVHVIAGT